MKFWDENGISLEAVRGKYKWRISWEDTCKCYIVSSGGIDFWLIQHYRNIDEPEYILEKGISDGLSIDLFIGEYNFLGKGFWKEMLKCFIQKIFSENKDIQTIYICHAIMNIAAIACSESVGFCFLRNVTEEGKICKLFKKEKNNV
jgi:RimJ/RimL family protein N-acetyltransferase